ncbi:DUF4138 domain-containing protein [Arenibacter sp. M-2]|uniref:DUF4138 domain-containing protein n=1 Tax=Arenibacter sp. M-2 TaxID=3053612 RepID=UPI002570C5AD|nr:DUF4138 domain-containing protein [Arenibacter sp. M-2]MDL5511251.1 DUF4138 domain-containing protein [Arenibacter sp. M-2]
MKNHLFISAFVLVSTFTKAQNTIALDTIYANDQKNVALFFPEPIRQGITGSDNFVFTYNRDNEQYLGLLQAKPGKESNLLVVNRDGSVFSYIIKYRERLSKLNYFIPMSSSIRNERPIANDSIKVSDSETVTTKSLQYYERFCSYLLDRKQRIGRLKKRKEGIALSVENIVFDKDELYFLIEITNNSSLDYDLNFLNLSIETRQKGKKKSLQKLYQEPLYLYNIPSRIAKNETMRLVYVLHKFSLSNERRAVLELNEKGGERNIELKVSHRFVNIPN